VKGGVIPTGTCWCGCGTAPQPGAFFMSGHDRRAAQVIIAEFFGSTANFVAAFGRAPTDDLSALSASRYRRGARLSEAASIAIRLHLEQMTESIATSLRFLDMSQEDTEGEK
jgi:hypothetical protein